VRVAEDVADRGFAWMDGLGSDEAFLEELRRLPNLHDMRDLAVMYALNGDLDEARETLMRLARPVSQQRPGKRGRGGRAAGGRPW
jgi:hypothetical protein